jgi:hypothetical protein
MRQENKAQLSICVDQHFAMIDANVIEGGKYFPGWMSRPVLP